MSSQYLILYVNCFHWTNGQNIPIDSVVSNFNLDRVEIPVTTNSPPLTYKVISAIVREGRQSEYGHYYTWSRYPDNWFRLDDVNVRRQKKFVNSNNNVQYYVLKKI